MLIDMTDQVELLGSREVCRELEIDKSTLTRWVAAGIVTAAKKLPGLNGAFLFTRTEIDRLKSERAAKAGA